MNKNVQDSQLSRSIPLDSAHAHKPPWSDQDVPSNPQNPPMSPEYSALGKVSCEDFNFLKHDFHQKNFDRQSKLFVNISLPLE